MGIEVDDDEALEELSDAERRARSLDPVLRVFAERFKILVDRSFRDQRTPDGKVWRPLNPRYRERKLRQGYGGRINIRTGLLSQTIRTSTRGGRITIGTNPRADYAAPVNAQRRFMIEADDPSVQSLIDELREAIAERIVRGA